MDGNQKRRGTVPDLRGRRESVGRPEIPKRLSLVNFVDRKMSGSHRKSSQWRTFQRKTRVRENSIDSTSSTTEKIDTARLIRKFKFWSSLGLLLIRMHQYYQKVFEKDNNKFNDQLQDIDQAAALGIQQDDLFFDPSIYKANRQMRVSAEAKRILSKKPEERTEQEIKYATIALRGNKQIANYPVRMQKNLATHGVFESYGEKRVIVRQGHPPQGFYYILYGTVVVAVLKPGEEKAFTACFLERGESFGELSILHGSRRQSTVITKTYTEFLCITPKVYQRIFMVGGVKNINDPDHENFIRSLEFLDGWPKEVLNNLEDPTKFIFIYTQRGDVIVKDSKYSNKIVIVKSGSLQVLKKLVKVTPKFDPITGKRVKRPVAAKRDKYEAFQSGTALYNRQVNTHIPSIEEVEIANIYSSRETDLSKDTMTRAHSSLGLTEENNKKTKRRIIKSANDSPRNNKGHSIIKQEEEQNAVENFDDERDDPNFKQQKRSFFDDLDDNQQEPNTTVTEADRNPQFVKVQNLTKGSVFGLSSIIFDDEPSLSLVSNGCEVILMDKKLYLENCPVALMRRLRTEVSPYPTDGEMQENLDTRINWEAYKQSNMNKVISDIQHLKLRYNYEAVTRPVIA